MRYGSVEYQYAAPIAQALVDDAEFRRWVLSRSPFAEYSDARILNKEISDHRGNATAEWWRFHFTEKCRCEGCSGKETDIFTVFERKDGVRFALHFEVKQPKDKFKADGIQARGYPLRADCWAAGPPARVLPHKLASTGIFFSDEKREEYKEHLPHCKTQITFEEIGQAFPRMASLVRPTTT